MKKYIGLIGILFLFPLIWVVFFGLMGKHKFNTLPFYEPGKTEAVDTSSYVLPPFSFMNQKGQVYTLDSLKGKTWVAAFYSMSDPNLAKITERLMNINFKFRGEDNIAIVCFSTDPMNDSIPELDAYVSPIVHYNEFPGKWQFLTGDSAAIANYLREGFFIQKLGNEAIFRLIDEEGHVRGMYGNTEYHIEDAMQDISLLRKESDLRKYNEKKAKEKN